MKRQGGLARTHTTFPSKHLWSQQDRTKKIKGPVSGKGENLRRRDKDRFHMEYKTIVYEG